MTILNRVQKEIIYPGLNLHPYKTSDPNILSFTRGSTLNHKFLDANFNMFQNPAIHVRATALLLQYYAVLQCTINNDWGNGTRADLENGMFWTCDNQAAENHHHFNVIWQRNLDHHIPIILCVNENNQRIEESFWKVTEIDGAQKKFQRDDFLNNLVIRLTL